MQKPGLFGMNGFLLFMLTCCSFALQAQQAGSLILIDAENKQPFTVRIGDQLFTSSGHGHLVLSHLKDSNYRLNLRFPKKNLTEQVFPVPVREKDLGFLLQGADSSWVLYNWQTKQTIHPVNDPDSSRILEMGVKREDGFSRLMAAVVDDTAVMYNTYTGNWFTRDSLSPLTANGQPPTTYGQPPATNSQPPAANRQPPTANRQLPTANGQPPTVNRQPSAKLPDSVRTKTGQPPTANRQPPPVQPGIKKLREVNLKISRKLVFLDMGSDGIKDTVTLFVFFETGDTAGKKPASAESNAKKKSMKTDSVTVNKAPAKNNAGTVMIPGCGELATDADLVWLRSAILRANTEPDKIAAATSAFALKCFSVNQVRVLAALFVSDKARYRLMDAARLHIADRDHFRELADMYTDKNFQKKFLVLADKRS